MEAELTRIVTRINAAYPNTVHFEVRSSMSPAARLQARMQRRGGCRRWGEYKGGGGLGHRSTCETSPF